MATHKDAIKRTKQNARRREANRANRTRMRNQIKKVRAAVAEGDVDTAQTELRTAQSIIQRVAQKGVIHKNAAARKVQRLNRAVKAIVQS